MPDFTRADVVHLLRRAGFGGTPTEISALVALPSWAAVVDRVLDTSANPPDVIPAVVDDTTDEYYPAWVAAVQYWLDRMATTPTPIVEKMTLFWHGNLASSTDAALPRLLFRQIRTYRSRALGDVHDLLQAMAIDPAMLLYLNNATNVAAEPNENFARELMELFTLGNGAFTEADVVGMARAWTGYNYDRPGEQFVYRPNKHDSGPKTIFGITKDWSGPEAITEIVRGSRQATCARYLAGKVWSFFAHPAPAAALVDDLATAFISSGMDVRSLLRAVPDPAALSALLQRLHVTGLTLFSVPDETDAAAPLEVRSWAPAHGVPEDPVCGSGNGAVAAYRATLGTVRPYQARQGRAIGRDGTVRIDYREDGIEVGGDAVVCVRGELLA